MPPQRLDDLLAEWRNADARAKRYEGLLRRFAEAEADSPPIEHLQHWAGKLREGEQRALAAVVGHVKRLESGRTRLRA